MLKKYYKLFLLLPLLCCHVHAGELQVRFTDSRGEPIVDAVLEIMSPQIPVPADWDYMGLMDQIDKEFIDNVVTIVAGTYVRFPNSDDIQHHVYSFSDNKSFELPLYSAEEAEPVLFDVPGVAVVGCNIHDWMLGYIYVSASHLVAKSDHNGLATLSNLQAGEYTFQIWHERARRGDQFSTFDTTVSENGLTTVDIELDLGRDRRIRRAPASTDKSYH